MIPENGMASIHCDGQYVVSNFLCFGSLFSYSIHLLIADPNHLSTTILIIRALLCSNITKPKDIFWLLLVTYKSNQNFY